MVKHVIVIRIIKVISVLRVTRVIRVIRINSVIELSFLLQIVCFSLQSAQKKLKSNPKEK